ncbi:NADPH-dependent FMN reductase [Actinoplanes siamensis]|uniref:NADPH-dependent FMN reductase-like domain-containing protein n=1 Tax=Actinoplanes siamensis TaxID=1223317 RepID=A0A919N6V5_9ACTN|nr:NAD(P)H-dependent oxidoreductase [Actinoplanes siamensis]GIF05435.1 hypothetical protein Asi03nite_29730 [Actinoplanes siamensis]
MGEEVTVLGVGGSMRADSSTELLLRMALREARNQGMRVKLFPLRGHPLPLFDPGMLADPPPAARLLLKEVRAAQAIVFASPVYHGTVGGAFKNTIDYLQALADDDPPWLSGKAVGLLAVGSMAGAALQAITAMEHITRALRAVAMPTVVAVDSSEGAAWGDGGQATIAARLERMCGELRRYACAGTLARTT